jgi:hypothetical protein
MTPGNARKLYLGWLRTTAPAVYVSAVRRATNRTRSLGGLTDNLLNSALSPTYRHTFLGDDGDSATLDTIDVSALPMDQPITTDFNFATPDTGATVDPGALQTVSIYGQPAPTVTTPAATSAPSGVSTLASVLTAVTALGAGVLNASNQSALIALNTQRAAQGLPPVNANGQVVTAAGIATTSPALQAFENAISGAGGSSMLPILLIGGLALFLLSGKKSSAPAAA